MKFQNPAGLWLLLGVPVLILIYIIKSQHEDKGVSSTYIWKLSNRFKKKKLPLERFRRILLFVTELLAIISAAMFVAQPALTGRVSCDYILVIDTSKSMMTADGDGTTRFARALDAADGYTEKVKDGHRVSVITTDGETEVLLERSSDIGEIKTVIGSLNCTDGEANAEGALARAAEVAFRCADPKIVLLTDRVGEETRDRVEVVDVRAEKPEWNLYFSDLQFEYLSDGIAFTGNAVSRGKDAETTVLLKINGVAVDALNLSCKADEPTEIRFEEKGTYMFETAEFLIDEEDGLRHDNSCVLCAPRERDRWILLVSEAPFYLQKAFGSMKDCTVTTKKSLEAAEYDGIKGYDLYIFDGVIPETLPEDGSVLIFGSENLPKGVTAGETYEKMAAPVACDDGAVLLAGISSENTVIGKYTELRCNASWKQVLLCNGLPVAVTRELQSGFTQTVLSFDLHDSNFPLQSGFVTLMRNLVRYAAPSILEKNDFTPDENVRISVMPGVKRVLVATPDGMNEKLSFAAAQTSYVPSVTGVYTVNESYSEEESTATTFADSASFYVHVPYCESAEEPLPALPTVLAAENADDIRESRATKDVWLWVAIAMLVLMLAEWGIYYYEQY